MNQLGFLDFDTRLQRINKAGDPLTELLRNGARQLLSDTVEVELPDQV